ncbi:hypothetical protein BC828DRAFT_405622 [Blastocladiella britannica]|nr:hypothetical protein BC828DRAFT_405622 [Blastocladiella britannica]
MTACAMQHPTTTRSCSAGGTGTLACTKFALESLATVRQVSGAGTTPDLMKHMRRSPATDAPAVLSLLAAQSRGRGNGNLEIPVEGLRHLVSRRNEYRTQQLIDWLAKDGPTHGVVIPEIKHHVELKAKRDQLQRLARLSIL